MTRRLTNAVVDVGMPVVAFLLLGWLLGLVVLSVWVVRVGRDIVRLRRAIQPTTKCPAGHEVSQFGQWTCSNCGALSNGWVWKCTLCGAEAGWTPCAACGLAVRNPLA